LLDDAESIARSPTLTPVACGYMILYADYGPHEHVFSPVSTLVEWWRRSVIPAELLLACRPRAPALAPSLRCALP
jgi:hypothetical protein